MAKLSRLTEMVGQNSEHVHSMTDFLTSSGINNTPLHRHQNANSMVKYVAPVISLLCLVLQNQNQEHYFMPLPTQTQEAIHNLKTSLISGNNVSTYIHKALTNLWTEKWSKREDNPVPCPMEQTLALLILDKNGGHQEPHNVTGYIAKLEYCI